MPKLHLITYGCQMNEYDSERVAGLLKHERYELTDSPEDADLILLNTCAIREKAEDKVYSELGTLKRLKARRPELLIGVMGCMNIFGRPGSPKNRVYQKYRLKVRDNDEVRRAFATEVTALAGAVGLTVPEWKPAWDQLPEEAQIPG